MITSETLEGRLPPILAFIVGSVLHMLVFRHGEWDLVIPRLLLVFIALQAVFVVFLKFLTSDLQHDTTSDLKAVTKLSCSLVFGIFVSMGIYRLFWHRLNKFPGPIWARLSNFYATSLASRNLQLYEEVEKLHKQFGDYVRLGPSELSINDPNAVNAIYSNQSPCIKGPWYDLSHPRVSLHMCRNKGEHAKRRKVWDRGFSAKALRDYEPRVVGYTGQLLAKIEASKGTPLNVTNWFNFYSFDVMGDLAFGKSFGMLQDGIKHYFMTTLHDDMTSIGYLSHLPWLFPFLTLIPIVNANNLKLWKWIKLQVAERKNMNPERRDVFSWILDDYEASSPASKQAELNLEEDAHLIVVAGSDTTAATLTSLFYHLATEPDIVARLREEIDEYFRTNAEADYISLSKLKYVDAVINETLRLHPAVPSGLQRMTPATGLTVGETFIPGNTIVQIPMHTLFRDERNFGEPAEFIPERWTSRPELVKDASTFIPFSIGSYSCIGKQLALMELRYVISHIIHKYDMAFAPTQTQQGFLKEKEDHFTLGFGPLELIFSGRNN